MSYTHCHACFLCNFKRNANKKISTTMLWWITVLVKHHRQNSLSSQSFFRIECLLEYLYYDFCQLFVITYASVSLSLEKWLLVALFLVFFGKKEKLKWLLFALFLEKRKVKVVSCCRVLEALEIHLILDSNANARSHPGLNKAKLPP